MGTPDTITTTDELRQVYRPPRRAVLDKEMPQLDDHCRAFIARSPILMVGTADKRGDCDVSPRGGPPGFVAVLSDGELAVPDLYGNHRLDSMQNLLTNTGIALLFMIPGLDETLRVNGRASISTDADTLAKANVDGITPRVAIVVAVQQAFIHCAKSFRRGGVWHPERWPDTSDMPSIACMIRDQTGLDGVDVEAVADALEASYQKTLWKAGGDTDG